jgi:hypothetical protein
MHEAGQSKKILKTKDVCPHAWSMEVHTLFVEKDKQAPKVGTGPVVYLKRDSYFL